MTTLRQPLRFRQIHLDFHTSGAISGLGERFDRKAYQETLKRAEVDSVTTFATCHHGWSYYETKIGQRHPGLGFDLLRAQFEACKEIGVNVPIYLTAGVHNVAAAEHPEWREIDSEGRFSGWARSNIEPGFKMLSFHSPYLDYLCEQVREVMSLFPEADGIFFDIINQSEDCSVWGLRHMQENGLDPRKEEDLRQSRMDALFKYYRRSTETVRSIDPSMPVFHNSGHITPGFREILAHFSHLELESLPTGGWGYDHFPLSAKYAHTLDMEFLGMTGKFHTTWGEFGGYKHPNALKYECGAMLAYGARCSVGDQLHPSGELDASTYAIIGAAYREVAQKERFVVGAENVADVALLSCESVKGEELFRLNERQVDADIGANRVLLEEHILFDVIDRRMDFGRYRMIVLADEVPVDESLKEKLDAYLSGGGKLFLTGDSGVDPDRGMLFEVGGEVGELSQYLPDYILPAEEVRCGFVDSPMVMYKASRRLTVTDGISLGDVYDPWFNREWDHFCSHQHAPARPDSSGFAFGVVKGNVLYLAHPVFTIYRSFGQVALREVIGKALRLLLADDNRLALESFPSTGRVTLMHQPAESRYVLHLLHANTINRGGASALHGGTMAGRQGSFEVIEEILPLYGVGVNLRCDRSIREVRLEPSGEPVDFEQLNGTLRFKVAEMRCHQMVALEY